MSGRRRTAITQSPTLLGQALKEYRAEHRVTQEELAEQLSVDVRTVRRYERAKNTPQNLRELRRIAEELHIEPEHLGLAANLDAPTTSAEMDAAIQHVWSLVDDSQIQVADRLIKRLIPHIESHITREDTVVLHLLAQANHAAGYTTSVATRSFEAYKAIPYYHRVEELGRIVHDDTLINIGLTYQGDMHTRLGEIKTAIEYLEAAQATSHADTAALGNGIQLLGRAYLRIDNLTGFERAMAESEELTATFDPVINSIHGHYNLGTVFEEYGRSYANLGRLQKAIDYLDKAKIALPQNDFWHLCVETARAIALVKGGEIRQGVELALETTDECYATGNVRFLDRVYIIQQYLEKLSRDIAQIGAPLRSALDRGQTIEV